MKVIVVDDNKLSREEVCEKLNKLKDDITVVKEFSNGTDALEWIKKNEVDLVFSDMQMPKMDGNKLLMEINKVKPDVKVVFLTCYDDFPYIQKALKNNAFDYVLKPLGDHDCMNILRKYYQETEKEENSISKKIMLWGIEQFLYKLLTASELPENYLEILTDLGIPKKGKKFMVADVKHNGNGTEMKEALAVIESIFNDLCAEGSTCYFVKISPTELAILCFGDIEADEIIDNVIAMQNKFSKNIINRIAFGISEPHTDVKNISLAYNEAKTALGYTVYSVTNRVLSYGTVSKLKNSVVSVSAILKELKRLAAAENKEGINFFIDKYLDDESYFNATYVKNFMYCLVFSLENILNEKGKSLESIDGTSIWEKIENFDSIVNVKFWIYNIISSAFDTLFCDKRVTRDDVVNAIKKIIENDYAEKITLKDISEKLHYSTKHLSVLFNEREGCSVSEYLMRFRIEKAKELLMNPNMKIYKVFEMVGYKKQNVFTKAFKKYTGCLPSEYQKAMEHRKEKKKK